MKAKPYNGHPSWAAWNVSLWILNDECLYNMARDCVRSYRNKTRTQAAAEFCSNMIECGKDKTPDGARWTVRNVRRAMADI